jgi:hypothetical protein
VIMPMASYMNYLCFHSRFMFMNHGLVVPMACAVPAGAYVLSELKYESWNL